MEKKLSQLKERLLEINDLNSAANLLEWDQATYMPAGGAPARARQMATLKEIAQEKFIDPAIGRLLDALEPYANSLPYDSDEASLIRVTRREYERMVRVPAKFMGELYGHFADIYQVWTRARPENNFALVLPFLEKTLDLSRKMANYFPGYEHIADPLIDLADYGMRAATIRTLFAELREQLVPIVKAITAQPFADDACLHQDFPREKELAFSIESIKRFGFDFECGRVDETWHPFETSFSIGDVRITMNYRDNYFGQCFFGVLHESGHGMYEQGSRSEVEGTPLAGGNSSGVHESQSRFWENIVGRSRNYWEFFYPRLQHLFPEQLGRTPLEAFYRAINKVEPTLIRTEADEVTYNLHVLLRFDFELALLEGSLAVRDLPEAWNSRYASDLGITPPNDQEGVLQDVHWYNGFIGGEFQGYTLGNILSAQFYETAVKAHPDIPAQIRQGQFGVLHGWLKENIYQHGSKFTEPEIIQRVTGGPIRIEPYFAYLRKKYGELYALLD